MRIPLCKPFCKKNRLEADPRPNQWSSPYRKPFCKKNRLEAVHKGSSAMIEGRANLSAKRIGLRRFLQKPVFCFQTANLSAKRIGLRRGWKMENMRSLTANLSAKRIGLRRSDSGKSPDQLSRKPFCKKNRLEAGTHEQYYR